MRRAKQHIVSKSGGKGRGRLRHQTAQANYRGQLLNSCVSCNHGLLQIGFKRKNVRLLLVVELGRRLTFTQGCPH